MDSDEFDSLKSRITRNYKCYTGQIKGGEATISDIARDFKIFVPKDKMDDFEIIYFELTNCKIRIKNKKSGITYDSQYIEEASSPNDFFDGTSCIRNDIDYGNDVKRISTYSLENRNVMAEKLSLKSGENEIWIELENLDYGDYAKTVKRRLAITLIKVSLNDKGEEEYSRLYAKQNIKTYCGENLKYAYQEYSASDENVQPILDKYQFKFANSIIYCIKNNVINRPNNNRLIGFCIEDFNGKTDDLKKYLLPRFIFNEPIGEGVRSIMHFTNSNRNKRNMITIIKTDDVFQVYYKQSMRENGQIATKFSNLFTFESEVPGKVTSLEIEKIANTITGIMPTSPFIEMVVKELMEFKTRIESKDEKLRDLSLIEPSIYLGLPFEKTVNIVINNQEEIFRQMHQELAIINEKHIETYAYKK